jgi:low temperature requirement protein LtrA
MGAMFVAALAVPEAFSRHGVVFRVAFLIVIVMQGALYALSTWGDRDLLAAIARVTPLSAAGATLIVVAGFVHGALRPALWLAALAIGLFAPLFTGVSGWIGESLVAIGAGRRHRPLRVRDEDDARARRRRPRHGSGARALRRAGALLLAYVGLRVRVSRSLGGGRLAAAVACAALLPVALVVPALVLMAAVWVALHAYELICWREARAQTRAGVPASAS